MRNNKPCEECLIEREVKTTAQILYDKGFFDSYDNADEVIEDYLFVDDSSERRGPNLDASK